MAKRISMSGGGGGGSGTITGGGAAGQATYWDGATSIAGNANYLYATPSSGALTAVTVAHPNDTASSSAAFIARVAGTSAADPYLLLDITSGTAWYLGNDNSASDALIAGTGSAVGTNPRLRLLTDGTASFWGPLIQYNTGGTAAQITEIYAGSSSANDGGLSIAGGNASGATIFLYGPTHATRAGQVQTSAATRIGTTGVLSSTNEQLSVQLSAVVGGAAQAHAALYTQYRNTADTAFSSTQYAAVFDWRRTVSTVTDTSTSAVVRVEGPVITVSGVYTNASHRGILVATPSFSGGGSLAIAIYSAIEVAASTTVTGARKACILLGAPTGATTGNARITDTSSFVAGDWVFALGSTNPSYHVGALYLGGSAVHTFTAEKLSVQDTQTSGAFNYAGAAVTINVSGNTASSGSGNLAGVHGVLVRTITSSTPDTQGRMAGIVAGLTIAASGVTYTNATTGGCSYYATQGSVSTGTLAITHYSLYYGSANSQAVTGTKYGLRLGSITGGSVANNAIWTDSGVISFNDYLEFRQNADPGATGADLVKLGAQDASAGNRTLHFRTEAAVAAGAVSPDATVPILWNGTVYQLCLKT